MTPDEAAAHWDDPANTQIMCGLLQRAHPGWTIRREAGVWYARYETWPTGREISDANAGALQQAIRRGGVPS